MKTRLPVLFLLSGALLLTGCSHEDNLAKLKAFVAAEPHTQGHIPPLPKITPYVATQYENPLGRDPFTSFSELQLRAEAANATSSPVPEHKGPLQPLEKYDLGSLTLTGIVQTSNGQFWGVFRTPDGKIYRATLGNGIGDKNGHIVAIDAKKRQVVVEQFLPNAFGGYQKQKTVMQMQSND